MGKVVEIFLIQKDPPELFQKQSRSNLDENSLLKAS